MQLFLADAVSFVHLLVILLVFVGIYVSVRVKWFRPIESAVLLLAIVIWSLHGGCPLTTLESYLRAGTSDASILREIGFIPFYLERWFGVAISPKAVDVWTYGIAIFFFVLTLEWLVPFIKKIPVLKLIHR